MKIQPIFVLGIDSDVFTGTDISMQSGKLAIDNGISKRVYVVVMDFGRPIEKISKSDFLKVHYN